MRGAHEGYEKRTNRMIIFIVIGNKTDTQTIKNEVFMKNFFIIKVSYLFNGSFRSPSRSA